MNLPVSKEIGFGLGDGFPSCRLRMENNTDGEEVTVTLQVILDDYVAFELIIPKDWEPHHAAVPAEESNPGLSPLDRPGQREFRENQ